MQQHDMRFTIVDDRGSVSFIGDGFLMLPLLAACSANPRNLNELLRRGEQIDRRLRTPLLFGLAIFDEHNVDGNYEAIHRTLQSTANGDEPIFRVVDDVTRQRSLEPTPTGLIIFNLKDHRIVEVINHFYAVAREGQVHLHNGMRYSRRTVNYALPASWSIVP